MTGKSTRLTTILDRSASLATIIAAAAVIITMSVRWERASTYAASQLARSPGSTVIAMSGQNTTLGQAAKRSIGAQVGIVEFSDFECPYCGQYARDIYPRVQHEFVETGVSDYGFRSFPLERIHAAAFEASESFECSGRQGHYWEMHDTLFTHQASLAQPSLQIYAAALGLNQKIFIDCLHGQASAQIRDDQAEARRFGVNSTPTFLIGRLGVDGIVLVDRKVVGVRSFEDIKMNVDAILVASPGARGLTASHQR